MNEYEKAKNEADKNTKIVNGVNGSDLKLFIDKIENLEEDKKNIAEDIKGVYSEVKAVGYDVKIVREVIKIRKQDKDTLFETECLIDIYKSALGMINDQ